MSEATLSLVSREALELHFEGVAYGPIAHTQALGVLLFALGPERVRCATPAGAFQAAMRQVLRAAQGTADLLRSWADEADEASTDPRLAHLPVWIEATCRTAPAHRVEALRAALTARLGTPPRRETLH